MPYVTNDGVRIHYEVEGSGTPLVLHGGFMGSIPDWYRIGYVAALKDDYQLVLLDPRGQGQSDKPQQPNAYLPEQRVADVVAVLDALDLEHAHFLGYSLGGRVGFSLGAQAPNRFLSLAIGGQHPFARDPRATAQMAALFRQEGIAGYIAGAEQSLGPLPPALRDQWLATNDAEACAANYEALGAWPGLEAELPAIQLPTFVFCGERDAPQEAQRAATLMPQATFLLLPGLNHAQAFQQSELVLPHLRALHARAEQAAVSGT